MVLLMCFCSFSARLKKINIFVYKVSAIRNLKRAARLICMYMLLFAFIRLNTLDSSMLKVFSQSIIIAIKTQHLSTALFSKEIFFLSERKLNHLQNTCDGSWFCDTKIFSTWVIQSLWLDSGRKLGLKENFHPTQTAGTNDQNRKEWPKISQYLYNQFWFHFPLRTELLSTILCKKNNLRSRLTIF